MAAPVWKDFSNLINVARTTWPKDIANLTGGGGLADNDIILAHLYFEAARTITVVPTDWTLLKTWDQDTGGFKYRVYQYWLRRVGHTGVQTWEWDGTSTVCGGMITNWSGAITTENPWATVGAADLETATGPLSNAGIVIERSASAAIIVAQNFSGAAAASLWTTGYTERIDSGRHYMAVNATVGTGATGAVSATIATLDYLSSVMHELASVAGAAAADPVVGMRQPDQSQEVALWRS